MGNDNRTLEMGIFLTLDVDVGICSTTSACAQTASTYLHYCSVYKDPQPSFTVVLLLLVAFL